MDEQHRWTHTREILSMLYNVNRGKNQMAKSGKDLIPLEIDSVEKETKQPLTVEQHNEAVKKLSKFFKN